MKKLYIIQKYVVATSVSQAIKIEKKITAQECWLDDDWKKAHKPMIDDGKKLGFKKGK